MPKRAAGSESVGGALHNEAAGSGRRRVRRRTQVFVSGLLDCLLACLFAWMCFQLGTVA